MNEAQEKWLEGFSVYFGAFYIWSGDGKKYEVVAADCINNEIRARQFGGSYIHWIGSSQDFARMFTKVK